MERGMAQALLALLAFADFGFERPFFDHGDAGLDLRLLGDLAVADVALHRDPMRVSALFVGDGNDAQLDPELLAVLSAIEQLGLDRFRGFERAAQAVENGAVDRRALQDARAEAEHFGLGVSGHAGESGVAVDDLRPWEVERQVLRDQDRVVGVHDGGLEQAEPLDGGRRDLCGGRGWRGRLICRRHGFLRGRGPRLLRIGTRQGRRPQCLVGADADSGTGRGVPRDCRCTPLPF